MNQPTIKSIDLQDLLFQADCVVHRAYELLEDGKARLVAVDPDTNRMIWDDGDSIEELDIKPIEDLLEGLKSGWFPKKQAGGCW